MLVGLEFWKKDGTDLYKDKEMSVEQLVALFNSGYLHWPNDDPNLVVSLEGKISESHYNPITNRLIVRINEL